MQLPAIIATTKVQQYFRKCQLFCPPNSISPEPKQGPVKHPEHTQLLCLELFQCKTKLSMLKLRKPAKNTQGCLQAHVHNPAALPF